MMPIHKTLFSPRGRMGRRDYLIGLAGIAVFSVVFNFVLARMGNSVWAFLISLPFPFIVLHMTYCVYGKRLHDLGRSFWAVTAMITALIAIAIAIMMSFGGAEYFAAFAEYDRKKPPTPEVSSALKATYEAELAKGLPLMNGLMLGVIGTFSLWLALAKPQSGENRYGPATATTETA
jgi:uncharacterized membrane protein YhaH (DUF805 family)